MKKYLMSIFTFILMFTLISSVSAKENVGITNVSISDKTDIMVANIKDYNGLTLNTKELFYEVGDFVTYNITIKNTTGKSLSVAKIGDNLNNEYISSEYNYDKKEIKNNEEYSFNITLKYKKEITDNSMTFNMPLNIVIDYTNGSSTGILVNPDTKDNVLIYFIIFVLSAISLVLFKTKKNKLLVFVIALGLIPSIAYAASKVTITMNNEIGIYKRLAIMDTGENVNRKLKELAGTDTSTAENVFMVVDNNIKHIVRARELPSNITLTNSNKISTENSVAPIYAWFDNETIYYYTEADTIYLNEDSGKIFINLSKVEDIDMSIFDTSNVTTMRNMFFGCESLKNINLSHFDTSNVTSMYGLFYDCKSLTELDLSNFNTSNVTDMQGVFSGCKSLTELDVSNFNTSKVTNISGMFQECFNLEELDVSNFDTSNVEKMYGVFLSEKKTETMKIKRIIGLDKWDTSKVKDFDAMFQYCSSLEYADVSNFDTSSATTMRNMFFGCKNLQNLDLSNFDTSKVIKFTSMFYGCSNIENLDLSSFDTSNATDMVYMFYNNTNLKKIYVSNKFDTSNVTESKEMFKNSTKLVGGNGTIFDSTKIDKEYARVDKEGTPGYFTLKN